MAKLTDGMRTVEIRMVVWEGTQYSPDMANDIFEVGSLNYSVDLDAYIVGDVEYYIEDAMDWKESRGDFVDDEPNSNREVFIDEI